MRILVVGGTGTIGAAVVQALTGSDTEVISVSRSSEPAVDITDTTSISAMYEAVGTVDAIVSTTGAAPFVATSEATPEQFAAGFADKLGGQINLTLLGLPHLRDGGSITLITGILAQHPVKNSVIAGTVNGGIEAFAVSAATDLPRGIRINVVSPNVIEEALPSYGSAFPGFHPVPAAQAAQAFVRSVHGVETGQVFRVWR
ncbi:short chain dehydrogenase [Brevibacterium daeguense]|uniref:Short chain dehydrogenase n=1 Tax=Brevibacterium daeguense TaxID=909936 RepID=A0ABP8EIC7_9MICO|nr:short chain dehydrogenase [Brevibacterium daeguense]